MQATVRTYDSLTKSGTLVSDDGNSEYVIDPRSIEEGMFRFLRPGQRVSFDLEVVGQEERATNLRIGIA